MLLLVCSCVCIISSLLGMCLVSFFVFPGLIYTLLSIVSFAVELFISFGFLWSELMMFLVKEALELIGNLVDVIFESVPMIWQIFRQFCELLQEIFRELLYIFNYIRVDVMNFFRYHMYEVLCEYFLLCWGFLLWAAYLCSNCLQPAFRNQNPVEEVNQDRLNQGENEQDLAAANNNNDMNDNVPNRNLHNNFDGDRNFRIRVLVRQIANDNTHQQHLYPLLPDSNESDSGEDFENEPVGSYNQHIHEYVNVDSDNRMCIVCMEHDRSTAVFPCGHTHMCSECLQNVMQLNGMCPICQRRILEYRTIYI